MRFESMRHRALILAVEILVFSLLLASSGCTLRVEPFWFDVTEVTVSRGIDMLNQQPTPIGIADRFSTHVSQIALCYRLETNTSLKVTYRWYRDGTLLMVHSVIITQAGRYCTTLVPDTRNGFSPGAYSAEIVLYDRVSQRVTFTVEND